MINNDINEVEVEAEVEVEEKKSNSGKYKLACVCISTAFLVALCGREHTKSNIEVPMTTTAFTTTDISTTTTEVTTSITTVATTTESTTEATTIEETTTEWSSSEEMYIPETEQIVEEVVYETEPPVIEIVEETEEAESTPYQDETTELELVGTFEGTFYTAYPGCSGGSGRTLIPGGSIASRTLYDWFGYNVDGRTQVYMESDTCPSLNGWYYLDDSTASWVTYVIDFYYDYEYQSPFQYTGRLYDVRVYI